MIEWDKVKNKRIYRVVIGYLVIGWALIEGASVVSVPLRLPDWISALVIVLVIFGLPIMLLLTWAAAPSVARIPDRSIAVLPFLNMSREASNEYFADGITENILTELSGIDNLKVISRTSIMRYKNTLKSVPEIASELGVRYIMEGSAQAQGDKVRINVQLIEAKDDRHVWARAFDEELKDIFAIQNSVANAIVVQLRTSIQSPDISLQERPTQNMEAYDLFLKGRFAWNSYTQEGFRQSEKYFKQAIDKDPKFKLAYSCLARSYQLLISWMGDMPPDEGREKSEFYLQKSASIAGASTDFMDCLTMGGLQLMYYKNFNKAMEYLFRAMALSPNDAECLCLVGYTLNMSGKSDQAIRYIEKARQFDPLSITTLLQLGVAQYLLGKTSEAIVTFKSCIELHPLSIRIYNHLSKVYLIRKEYDDAIMIIEKSFLISVLRPPSTVAYLAIALWNKGQRTKSMKLVREITDRSEGREKGINVFVSQFYAETSQIDIAIEWLEKSVDERDVDLFWLNVEPMFRNLRGHTKFREIQKRLGLD